MILSCPTRRRSLCWLHLARLMCMTSVMLSIEYTSATELSSSASFASSAVLYVIARSPIVYFTLTEDASPFASSSFVPVAVTTKSPIEYDALYDVVIIFQVSS